MIFSLSNLDDLRNHLADVHATTEPIYCDRNGTSENVNPSSIESTNIMRFSYENSSLDGLTGYHVFTRKIVNFDTSKTNCGSVICFTFKWNHFIHGITFYLLKNKLFDVIIKKYLKNVNK